MRIYLELTTDKNANIYISLNKRNKTRNAWMEESSRYTNTENLTIINVFINAKIKNALSGLIYI